MVNPSEPTPTKLCVAICSSTDADALVQVLVARQFATTKVASTGGFLRRGTATILAGVPADKVDEVLALVRETCHARMEFMPTHSIPFGAETVMETGFEAEAIEVRVGGAITFVVDVERFQRI